MFNNCNEMTNGEITLSIPTHNRFDYLFESFANVISNKKITEVCIVDDFSNIEIYHEIIKKIKELELQNKNYTKVKLYRNEKNLGSFFNKLECVKKATNKWIILLDSDNIIDNDYINIVSEFDNINTIYAPCHAVCESPILNYNEHSGKIINKLDYKKLLENGISIWSTIFNTGNYFFYKENYLKCVELEASLLESQAFDAYYLVYLWFKNLDNSKFEVVKNLKYFHRLHNQSYFQTSNSNHNLLNEINNKVKLWI